MPAGVPKTRGEEALLEESQVSVWLYETSEPQNALPADVSNDP